LAVTRALFYLKELTRDENDTYSTESESDHEVLMVYNHNDDTEIDMESEDGEEYVGEEQCRHDPVEIWGSPEISHKTETASAYEWELSADIPLFPSYRDYLTSVTKGGSASGHLKHRYKKLNKSKPAQRITQSDGTKQDFWSNFTCSDCIPVAGAEDRCSHQVTNRWLYLPLIFNAFYLYL